MTEADIFSYLDQRASAYGGDASNMLELTPEHLWDSPSELYEFWESKHLSHVYPQSTHPELADNWDNIIAEDPPTNLARGAEVITADELNDIQADNAADALEIDAEYLDDSPEFLEAILEVIT